jgi:hypothetical protein
MSDSDSSSTLKPTVPNFSRPLHPTPAPTSHTPASTPTSPPPTSTSEHPVDEMAQLREEVMRAGETPAEQVQREKEEGKEKDQSWQEVMQEFEERKERARGGYGRTIVEWRGLPWTVTGRDSVDEGKAGGGFRARKFDGKDLKGRK